jgi:hypothetical protein
MEKSTSISNLLAAIQKVQNAVPSINKDATGYNYKYATLDDIWSSISEEMAKAKLYWTTAMVADGLWTRLSWIDVDKIEFIESIIPFQYDPNPQKVGSVVTYYRRYALVSILNLMLNEDDDGASAVSSKCCKCERTDTKQITIKGANYWVCPIHAPQK